MRIKMLRKNKDGKTEVFYVNSLEEKQLYDTKRKKYRQLDYQIPDTNTKNFLRDRQKLARELRDIVKKLKGVS